jgi:transcriptional regulator with XRE-family HTH domain
MLQSDKIGKRISTLRKEKRLSQEELAEQLNVSPQAVSKWETGRSLPETANLPLLSQALGHTIDSILLPQELTILSALYTDGDQSLDVSREVSRFVSGSRLVLAVQEHSFPAAISSGRPKVLLLKYEMDSGIFAACIPLGETAVIDEHYQGHPVKEGELEFVHAAYGNEAKYVNVMRKLNHYRYFRWGHFSASHELFPSLIQNEGPDYLLIAYVNATGIHAVSCLEGERLCYTPDRASLYRESAQDDSCIVENVGRLGFGKGMDCSWAGAMLTSLRAMGVEADYETVMGASGACWRSTFAPIWDYSSADALAAYDYAAPAFQAYGFTPVWTDRISRENRAAERQLIMADIKSRRLPLAIHLRVAPEWGVLTGYLDNGDTFLCRSYFDDETFEQLQDDQEFQEEMRNTKGYLYVDQWPYTIVRLGDRTDAPTPRESLLASLQIKIHSMSMNEAKGYKLGYRALEEWSAGLLDEWYQEADEPDVARRMSVNHFCMMALVDARRCAAAYLMNSLPLLEDGEGREQLEEMASLYKKMHGGLEAFFRELPGDDSLQGTGASSRQIWTVKLRCRQAELLQAVIGLERTADELARQVLLLVKHS